jgi:hypothetical protein
MHGSGSTTRAADHSAWDDGALLLATVDRASLDAVYDRFSAVLYGAAMRMAMNEKQAAMILERVFLSLLRPGERYSLDQGRPLLWLLARVHAIGASVLELPQPVDPASGTEAAQDRHLQVRLRCFALAQHPMDGANDPAPTSGVRPLLRNLVKQINR